MNWDTLDLTELGQASCGACGGTGGRLMKKGEIGPCECSLRSVFRACYERFRQCVRRERRISQVSYNLNYALRGATEEGCAARDHWATPENMG